MGGCGRGCGLLVGGSVWVGGGEKIVERRCESRGKGGEER